MKRRSKPICKGYKCTDPRRRVFPYEGRGVSQISQVTKIASTALTELESLIPPALSSLSVLLVFPPAVAPPQGLIQQLGWRRKRCSDFSTTHLSPLRYNTSARRPRPEWAPREKAPLWEDRGQKEYRPETLPRYTRKTLCPPPVNNIGDERSTPKKPNRPWLNCISYDMTIILKLAFFFNKGRLVHLFTCPSMHGVQSESDTAPVLGCECFEGHSMHMEELLAPKVGE